jgi:hypothetical protein
VRAKNGLVHASHAGEPADATGIAAMAMLMTRAPQATRISATRPTRALSPGRGVPVDAAIAVALTCLPALVSLAAEPDKAAAEIVAAQIRAQGYACTQPVAAERDQAASQPNATVWLLSCGNARYRVRLVPDMAAQVTQLK